MGNTSSAWEELATLAQIEQLRQAAEHRRWGLSLLLLGWLHLAAFSGCDALTILFDYHEPGGYLALWVAELLGVGLIFYLCGKRKSPDDSTPLSRFIVRVWIAYFVLAFNLGSMNTLRGNRMFELFPAMASLASFAFLVMTFAVSRRFFWAVLVMFAAGLLMASFLSRSYLIFAVAWWLVLNGIGLVLLRGRPATLTDLIDDSLCQPGRAGHRDRRPPTPKASPIPSGGREIADR
jgi:hypothetical protein